MTHTKEEDGLRFDGRMSDLEALLWRLEEHDPALRSTITVLVTFDQRPDPVAVARRVDRLSRRLPRLRDRVAAGLLPTVPPRWEPDPEFDMEHHLIRVAAPSPVSLPELLRAAEPLAAGPFERDRPPWQMLLMEGPGGESDGYPGGGAALVVKLHHTFTDGLGAVKLAAQLFDLERHPPPDGALPRLPEPDRAPRLGRMWDDLAFEAGRSVELARRVLPWATTAIRDAVVDPQPRAEATLELAHALQSLARAASRPASPILAGRSAGARLGAMAFPLSDLRQAARRAGGTVNDVFLAAALGGLRLYHAKRGSHPASLRLGIPVSTRGGGTEADMRNQFAPTLVHAPLQLLDPVERIRLLHELVIAACHPPVLDLLEQATGMLRRIPGSMRLITGLLDATDMMASNVPGSPVDLYLGGARVEQIVPIGPRGGAGLNLTLLSHVDTVHIGVNMDPVSISDPGVLIDCLRAGFDETLG
jgi:WS/DGAT/MGAT family acyltransferase